MMRCFVATVLLTKSVVAIFPHKQPCLCALSTAGAISQQVSYRFIREALLFRGQCLDPWNGSVQPAAEVQMNSRTPAMRPWGRKQRRVRPGKGKGGRKWSHRRERDSRKWKRRQWVRSKMRTRRGWQSSCLKHKCKGRIEQKPLDRLMESRPRKLCTNIKFKCMERKFSTVETLVQQDKLGRWGEEFKTEGRWGRKHTKS